MARKSLVERDKKRRRLVQKYAAKRAALKAAAYDRSATAEERFTAQLKLAELPRNSSRVRVRNRCSETGRARGVYRKFGLSRGVVRDLASRGLAPGVTRSSW